MLKELEKNGKTDVHEIGDKILFRVFHYKDEKASYDNDIQLDEMNSKSEV